MPNKLTQEEYQNQLLEKFEGLIIPLSEYSGTHNPITVQCIKHKNIMCYRSAKYLLSEKCSKYICPECKKEHSNTAGEIKQCAYCGKEIYIKPSRIKNNKTGMYFCCQEHFIQAAKEGINSKQFKALIPRPSVNSNGFASYRKQALRHYPNECAVCGYNEEIDILEVHHIDENRQNNNLENLIILCPNCHKKLTLHKYKLIDRKYLQKI